MNEIVEKVCQLPKCFKQVQNKSVYHLLKDSGCFEQPGSITMKSVENYLSNNKNLIKDWLTYSESKRCTSGWYFLSENNCYIVGFHNNGTTEKSNNYQSPVEACAIFIQEEINDIKGR